MRNRPYLSQHLAIISAVLLPLLGGCAVAPDWAKVGQQAYTIRAACERQHNDGLISSARGTEICANDRIRQLYADAGYPQMDVLTLYLQQREAIAAAVDRGTITAADAHVKLAEAQTLQNMTLQQHGLDPVVYDTAPYKVVDLCQRVDSKMRLCN